MYSLATIASLLLASAAPSIAAPRPQEPGPKDCHKFHFAINNPGGQYDGYFLKNIGGPIGIDQKDASTWYLDDRFNNFYQDGNPHQPLRILTQGVGPYNRVGDLLSVEADGFRQIANATFYANNLLTLRLGGGDDHTVLVCPQPIGSETDLLVSIDLGARTDCVATTAQVKALPVC